jgi:polar amino acid transport system substrate-binding protein
MPTPRAPRLGRRAVLAVLAGLGAGGPACAQAGFDLSPEQSGRARAERDPATVAAIPNGFRFVEPGTLTVAISPGGPPLATYATDARSVVGADPDFAQLIADCLGLRLALVPVAWADWPLGLTSGKYDAVISNVGVTEQRKEKFDFSTYRRGVHGVFARADSKIASVTEPKDAAGLRVIVGAGTNQERILLEWSRQDVAAGRKPLELQYYDDVPTELLALAAGRADAVVAPHAQLVFIAARDRNIRQVGLLSAGWPLTSDVAITTRKGSGLVGALTAVTNRLIANGLYARMLKRWGLQEEALPRSETNPPGLPQF